MSNPFIGEIVMFGGNFAPRGWSFCDGHLLAIAQNTALFSILGTTFGGDGRTTFGLPDLRGRLAMHAGNGPGLSSRRLGQKSGGETVTLVEGNLPSHTHQVRCNSGAADSDTPVNAFHSVDEGATESYHTTGNADMNALAALNAGAGQSWNKVNPFTTVNFIIALVGTFPSRN